MRGLSFHLLILISLYPAGSLRGKMQDPEWPHVKYRDGQLVTSSWLPRTRVRLCPAMDGDKVLIVKGENLLCYYVLRIAFSLERLFHSAVLQPPVPMCHGRVWYERKIELTVGHVDVNRTLEAPEPCYLH